jgi:hypothetical protein
VCLKHIVWLDINNYFFKKNYNINFYKGKIKLLVNPTWPPLLTTIILASDLPSAF